MAELRGGAVGLLRGCTRLSLVFLTFLRGHAVNERGVEILQIRRRQ